MATISLNTNVVTTINTFTFEPEHQQRGLELLVEIARRVRKEVPGLLAAHFHTSIDGTRVGNYAQYASHEAVEVATAKIFSASAPEMMPLLAELREIATPDSREYAVRIILER